MKWPEDTRSARKLQQRLRLKVRIAPVKKAYRYVAGIDAAFLENTVIGAAALFTFPDLKLVEEAHAVTGIPFPYIPGLLSFREGPALIKALRRLRRKPHLLLCDGQGIAHPLGFGIASHIGVLLNIPSIGCAKSRLVGEYREPGIKKGSRSALRYSGKIVGTVLRTRDAVRPVFVSPGHLTDIPVAASIVLTCCTRYRLPDPLRHADRISKQLRQDLT